MTSLPHLCDVHGLFKQSYHLWGTVPCQRKNIVMLCDICIDVLKHRANLMHVGRTLQDEPLIVNAHHRTTQSLQSSAAEGCHVCMPFWNQLDKHEQKALQAVEERRIQEEAADLERLQPDEQLEDWLTYTLLSSWDFNGRNLAFNIGFKDIGIEWESVAQGGRPALSSHFLQLISGSA